jgi:DNA polymerase III subunit delta'
VLSYSAVVGHTRQTTLLAHAIARGTLPPTLLFTGPAGVGKHRVVVATAAALNCLTPIEGGDVWPVDACGTCRACDRIARGVHVDVLAIEPDDRASIKIDVIRDVLDRAGFRPFEGRRRVVSIREAETLEVQAQNALLKSLEEPPQGTVFILTSSVPGVLLPTVRSRCMAIRFGRLTESDVESALTRDHGLGARDAREAAALSDGSVGQALALGSADLADIRNTAWTLLRQAASARGVASSLQAAGALAVGSSRKERTREELALVLRVMASMLRDVELIRSGADTRALAHGDLESELETLGRALDGTRTREAFARVDRALAALERNAGIKVVSEWLATQI